MGELDFDTVRRSPGETMARPSQAKVNSRTSARIATRIAPPAISLKLACALPSSMNRPRPCRPRYAAMVAVETICSVELLTPEIMRGNAHGSCTLNRICSLNSRVRSCEDRWNRKQNKHNDGGNDVDELPADDRRDDQEEQHEQPQRRQGTQRVRRPGHQRLTPSRVADENSQRHRDDQGGQQRDRRVQEVVADLGRNTS